jgi:hypothetical protein
MINDLVFANDEIWLLSNLKFEKQKLTFTRLDNGFARIIFFSARRAARI